MSQLTSGPLAKPCDVPWNAMQGGDRFRHCAACDKEVWNLSAMSAREAEVRLLNAPSIPCINYRVDEDGKLVTREEARVPARRLGLGAAAFVAGTLLAPPARADDAKPAQTQSSGKTPQSPSSGKTPQSPSAKKAAPAPAPAPPPNARSERDQFTRPEDCPEALRNPSGTVALNDAQPARAPSAAAAPASPAAAPAKSPADTPPQPTPRPEPQPLGGAPPPPRDYYYGTVQLKSSKPRTVEIDGVSFTAPTTIKLPPGHHEAQYKDGKKTIKTAFEVAEYKPFTLDLDNGLRPVIH